MKSSGPCDSDPLPFQLQMVHLRASGDYAQPLHTVLEQSLLPWVQNQHASVATKGG